MIPSLTTNQAHARSAAPRPARVPTSARPRSPTLPSSRHSVTVSPIKHYVGSIIKQVVEIRNFQRLTSSPADTVITASLTGELSSFCLKVYPGNTISYLRFLIFHVVQLERGLRQLLTSVPLFASKPKKPAMKSY